VQNPLVQRISLVSKLTFTNSSAILRLKSFYFYSGYNILSSITYFPSLQEETMMKGSNTNLDKMFSSAITSTPCHSVNLKNKDNVKSPMNGPHGLKFFVDPRSGRVDLKASLGPSSSESLDRRRTNIHFPTSIKQPRSMSVTQIMPMSGYTTGGKKTVPASISSYCTLTRRAPRILPDPEASSKQLGVFKIPYPYPGVDSISKVRPF
jgi:hypothetical protein